MEMGPRAPLISPAAIANQPYCCMHLGIDLLFGIGNLARITTALARQYCMAGALILAVASAGHAQIPEEPEPSALERLETDIDALIVASNVTLRCALYDNSIAYLTPLEQVGASLRLGELSGALASAVEDTADRTAQMRREASAIACGNPDLVPYLDFGRQVARDVIDVALTAWRDIEIESCNYFVDDDFLAAVSRVKAAAERSAIEGTENRVQFIEQQAAAWVAVFDSNCGALYFNPVETVPGIVALAIPSE